MNRDAQPHRYGFRLLHSGDCHQFYESLADSWLAALELRTPGSAVHARRVAALALRLARKMGKSPGSLGPLRLGALLHDLGKIVIPDRILHHPGRLTDTEFSVIQAHPTYGRELLAPLAGAREAFEVVYSHHEKWNGSGYPQGLAGEHIPWPARLVALADVWDALGSDRPYRPAWPRNRALGYVLEQAGLHFDPEIVEAFVSLAP